MLPLARAEMTDAGWVETGLLMIKAVQGTTITKGVLMIDGIEKMKRSKHR